MEPKKNSNADLTRYRNLMLSVGLLVSLSAIITAFEWRTYDDRIDLLSYDGQIIDDNPVIPSTVISPPPPPAKPIPILVSVPNDKDIVDDLPNIDVGSDNPTPILLPPDPPAIEPELYDEPVLIVEISAAPENGFAAFYQDLANRMKYPAQARRMQVEGRVFVEFVINRDGSITDVKVVKGIGGGCDEEAVRVLETSPRWKPGKQRGVPVRQRMVLPIIFKLS